MLELPLVMAACATQALQLAEGSELLLAGHASGRVVLWDVMTGVVLKEVTDLHTEAVSHLRFLHPARPHAISADATGATHLIQFHRILMSHTVSRQVCH